VKTKRTLQSKFKLCGSSGFTSSLSGEAIRPSGLSSVMHFFSHSIKLRGLLENVYAGLWNTSRSAVLELFLLTAPFENLSILAAP